MNWIVLFFVKHKDNDNHSAFFVIAQDTHVNNANLGRNIAIKIKDF